MLFNQSVTHTLKRACEQLVIANKTHLPNDTNTITLMIIFFPPLLTFLCTKYFHVFHFLIMFWLVFPSI